MASPVGKISGADFRHWGYVALMACLAVLLDVVANTVIPDLSKAGGPLNATIVAGLTLLLDLGRRWLTDTRKVSPTEADRQVIKSDFFTNLKKRLGF